MDRKRHVLTAMADYPSASFPLPSTDSGAHNRFAGRHVTEAGKARVQSRDSLHFEAQGRRACPHQCPALATVAGRRHRRLQGENPVTCLKLNFLKQFGRVIKPSSYFSKRTRRILQVSAHAPACHGRPAVPALPIPAARRSGCRNAGYKLTGVCPSLRPSLLHLPQLPGLVSPRSDLALKGGKSLSFPFICESVPRQPSGTA